MRHKHDEVVFLHCSCLVQRDGHVGTLTSTSHDVKLDVVERTFHRDQSIGHSCAVECFVFLARGCHGEEVPGVHLQIKVEVFQMIVFDLAFHRGFVAQGIDQNHILKTDTIVVDEYSGTEGVEGIQIANLTASVIQFQSAVNIEMIGRTLDGRQSIAKALHTAHNAGQQRAQRRQTQRVHLDREVDVVLLLGRIIGTVGVQGPLTQVEDLGVDLYRLVGIVPHALHQSIADRLAIHTNAFHRKVSQDHGIVLHIADQTVTRDIAIDVEAIEEEIDIGDVETTQLHGEGVAFFHRHITVGADRLLVVAEHQIGDVDMTIGEVDKVVGRDRPKRVVDQGVQLCNGEDAALLMRVEISRYLCLVVVFQVIVIPKDICENSVVRHSGNDSEIIQTQLQCIGLRDFAIKDLVQFQRGECSITKAVVLQLNIIEVQFTDPNLLGTEGQVERVVT